MFKLALAVALSVIAATAQAASAAAPLGASFTLTFGKATAHPCVAGAYVCGSGTVAGYGPASMVFVFTGGGAFDGACIPVTADETITLADGSGSVTLAASGSFCAPAVDALRSTNGLKSFGNPYGFDLAYTVSGGTGVFAGTTGSGTIDGRVAGDAGHEVVSSQS